MLAHDTYNGMEISLEPYAETVVRDTKSFDEYLWTPNYEEQSEMLATAFPREALDFAWRDYPEYVRTIPKGTTTSAPARSTTAAPEDSFDPTPVIAPPLTRAPQKAPVLTTADVMAAEIAPEDDISLGNWAKPAAEAPAPAAAQPAHADIIARARKHLANQ